MRPGDRAPGDQPDGGPGPRDARGHAAARARPADQGPQDRGRPRVRGRAQAGLRPRSRRRRAVRPQRRPDARPLQAAHDRGRRRPVRRPPGGRARGLGPRRGRPADRPRHRRGRARPRRRRGSRTRSRPPSGWARASCVVAPAPREGESPTFDERRFSERYSCPYDGTTIDELEPRSFSFNSPHGACPDLHGARDAAGHRPGPDHPGQVPEHQGRRAGALEQDADRDLVADEDHGGDLRVARLADRRPGQGPPRRGDPVPALRAQGREGRRALPPRARREQLRGDVRGRGHQPRAPVQGDRVRVHPDRAREVHGPEAVPHLQGPAAAARGAGRDRRRPEHLRGRDAVGDRRARLGGGRSATGHRARADDRPPGPQGDRGPARASSSTSGSTTSPSTGRASASRAARRSGSGWRPRSGRR